MNQSDDKALVSILSRVKQDQSVEGLQARRHLETALNYMRQSAAKGK